MSSWILYREKFLRVNSWYIILRLFIYYYYYYLFILLIKYMCDFHFLVLKKKYIYSSNYFSCYVCFVYSTNPFKYNHNKIFFSVFLLLLLCTQHQKLKKWRSFAKERSKRFFYFSLHSILFFFSSIQLKKILVTHKFNVSFQNEKTKSLKRTG